MSTHPPRSIELSKAPCRLPSVQNVHPWRSSTFEGDDLGKRLRDRHHETQRGDKHGLIVTNLSAKVDGCSCIDGSVRVVSDNASTQWSMSLDGSADSDEESEDDITLASTIATDFSDMPPIEITFSPKVETSGMGLFFSAPRERNASLEAPKIPDRKLSGTGQKVALQMLGLSPRKPLSPGDEQLRKVSPRQVLNSKGRWDMNSCGSLDRLPIHVLSPERMDQSRLKMSPRRTSKATVKDYQDHTIPLRVVASTNALGGRWGNGSDQSLDVLYRRSRRNPSPDRNRSNASFLAVR